MQTCKCTHIIKPPEVQAVTEGPGKVQPGDALRLVVLLFIITIIINIYIYIYIYVYINK